MSGTTSTQPDYGKDSSQVGEFFLLAANGDPEAGDFLNLWHRFNHEVDDVIDDNDWTPESILSCCLMACTVYSHPFFVRNAHHLQMAALLATSMYADSVKWEKDPALWKRRWADVMRHAGNEVIYATAMITGGWTNLRKIGAPLMAVCYVHHADKYGTPDEPK